MGTAHQGRCPIHFPESQEPGFGAVFQAQRASCYRLKGEPCWGTLKRVKLGDGSSMDKYATLGLIRSWNSSLPIVTVAINHHC